MNPYFPEAFNYPVYRNFAVSQFLTNSISLDLSIKPTSINPVCVSNHTSTIFDTLVVLLVNTDINSGTSTPSVTAPVELLLSRIFMQDYQAINQQYYLKTQSANLSFLFTKHILNNLEISGGTSTSGGITAFPNPLYMNVQDQKSLTIILPAAAGNKEVELNIYTANLNKVFSGKKVPFLSGNLIIQWNPLTERQVEISTGVYIYTVKINDDLLNGKFCIIR
jgi:hypothetical protein